MNLLAQKQLLYFISILLLFLVSTNSCYYPYTLKKARDARKAAKMNKKLEKQLKKNASTDSLAQVILDQNKVDSTLQNEKRPSIREKIRTSQTDSNRIVQKDSSFTQSNDSLSITIDSSFQIKGDRTFSDSLARIDSIIPVPIDTTPKKEVVIELNPDSLSGPLQYNAIDSMIYDLSVRKIRLYGTAEVAYENYELTAGYIELDFNTFTATAEGLTDSLGKVTEAPFFSDGTQKFNARKIQYNFKSKKGKVYDASTEQGDGFFLSKATKFISKDADSLAKDNIIYSGGCTYTTCNHRHPHFGIRSSKAKVIPNKLIVVGPSYLEIMGTPTPVVLPFGFFPITQKRRSGLILSTNVDNSSTLGIGLRGMGYYFGINESIDLALTGDFYTRGTFRLYANSNYNKRYRANGNVRISYARTKIDEFGTPDYDLRQDFNFSWSHNQDPKAHPSQVFNASVNLGTSDYYRNTDTRASSALQSTLQSNVSYTKRFTGTPFSLAVGMTHSQNTSSNLMNFTLPRTSLTMNQIFPLKRKTQVGKQRWYEKIGFSYNMTANNRFTVVDSLLFDSDGLTEAIENANYSIVHAPRVNMSFKLFKYINFQPNINYREYWYFYSNEKDFDPSLIIENDTIWETDEQINIEQINSDTTFGTVTDVRDYGFHAVRDFSAGVNMSTQLFATGTYNILGLHKVRAVIRPSVGFSWRPDYSDDFWGYYGEVQTDTRYVDSLFLQYRRFDNTPGAGEQALLTYSANMRMEGKLKRFRIDSTIKEKYRKVVILNNLSVSGNYNMAADSLKLSVVNVAANTTLFKLIRLNASFIFDPYAADINSNTRINSLEWNQSGRLARLTSGSIALSTNLTSQSLKQLFNPDKKGSSKPQKPQNNSFDILQNLSLNYNLRFNKRYIEGVDSLVFVANELALNGTVNLSKNWNIRINRIGYDFDDKRITYPDFTFSRRLHCWEMGLNWQPERKTWNFFLQVRPGSLGFIKIPVRKTQFDPF